MQERDKDQAHSFKQLIEQIIADLRNRDRRTAEMLSDAYFSGDYDFFPLGDFDFSPEEIELKAIGLVGVDKGQTYQGFSLFGIPMQYCIDIMSKLFQATPTIPKEIQKDAKMLTRELIREAMSAGLSVMVGIEFTKTKPTNEDQVRIFVPKLYRFLLGGRDQIQDDRLIVGASACLLHDEFLQKIKRKEPRVIRF